MNILSYICGFLLLFTLLLGILWEKKILQDQSLNNYVGYCNASRIVQNNFEGQCFHSAPEVRKPSKQTSELVQNKENTASKPKKKEESLHSCALLNLYLLFLEGKETHPDLYALIKNLLYLLYDQSFSPTESTFHWEKFLDQWIEAAHQKIKEDPSSSLFLSQLVFPDSQSQGIYYRLLKGSGKYSFGKEGYPSLLLFVKIESNRENKLCIRYLSEELLNAMFPKEITQQVIEKREEKKNRLKKEEILALFPPGDVPFLPLLTFSHPFHSKGRSKILLGLDKSSQIQVQRTVYSP